MSHGAQDVYPNYIKVQKGLGNRDASIATMIGQCGVVAGGSFAGTTRSSLAVGLRLCCFGPAVIPFWTLPSGFSGLVVGEFFLQGAQNGAWGVIPVLFSEYTPPQFRG